MGQMATVDVTMEALGGGWPGRRGALGWRPCFLSPSPLPANSRAPQGMFSCLSLMA